MSLHTQCPQRLVSTLARRTAWQWRGVRHYASAITNGPEWFQQLRSELLSREAIYQREDLDLLHHEQLVTTLAGFAPETPKIEASARLHSPVPHVLTRFNLRVPSTELLPDGTDPLHSPGEPWVRRMWAGGAVKLNPNKTNQYAGPFRLESRVVCLERIKDVRLQGEDDTAKIFVTIERRFAAHDYLMKSAGSRSGAPVDSRRYFERQVRDGAEWGDALLIEERNLVFLKAKTGAELEAIQAGETIVPRYLASPTDPEYTHTLTPTRSLLFRYSAVTFNAHLLHLDPTYARNVEGHRNLLVHGPLTLTLMLQTLTKHLRLSNDSPVVDSVEYRNLAPLYCDEEMRICVKKRKETNTGNAWDVWIEGPTGGMAVKAVARRAYRGANRRMLHEAEATRLSPENTAAPVREPSPAADPSPSSVQLDTTRPSRTERRKAWRMLQRSHPSPTALPYLYAISSPLSAQSPSPPQPAATQALEPTEQPLSKNPLIRKIDWSKSPAPPEPTRDTNSKPSPQTRNPTVPHSPEASEQTSSHPPNPTTGPGDSLIRTVMGDAPEGVSPRKRMVGQVAVRKVGDALDGSGGKRVERSRRGKGETKWRAVDVKKE